MRAVVFANGEPPGPALAAEACRAAALVVAADGGAAAAVAAGVRPHVVIGDLDSLDESVREALDGVRILRDADPDRTDLQKALDLCVARGFDGVTVLGAGGRRADHALANLSVLLLYRGRLRVTFLDEQFAITAVSGEQAIEGPPGTVVSLVAVGHCRGVTTRGLRWDLTDAALDFSPLGVHNEIRESPASVRLEAGDLLLFHGRWVEQHG